jgi:hypothetical protein
VVSLYVDRCLFVYSFIGVWLNTASAKIFASSWLVSLIAPYIKMAAPLLGIPVIMIMGIWGVCNWNEFGTFYYFSGFLGYIILAYYLVKYPLNWSGIKHWL